MSVDSTDNGIDMIHHFLILETNDPYSIGLNQFLPFNVPYPDVFLCMYFTIHFDDKFQGITEEIGDINTKRVLSPELIAARFGPQESP